MQITLTYVGYLDIEGVKSGGVIDLAEGTTVGDLLTQYRIKPHHQKFVRPIVNGQQEPVTHVLQDGDAVTLFLPVGGG